MEQNLSQYHIFYVTARCGNISKASRELFISQPAVSKAIQKLEQTLNTVLFRRGSRGVTLTEDGELLYRHVREAFTSLEAAEQSPGAQTRLRDLAPAHRRQHNSVQICASAVSAAVYPASSSCKNHHYMPVHLPDSGAAAGRKNRHWTGRAARYAERLRIPAPAIHPGYLCGHSSLSIQPLPPGGGQRSLPYGHLHDAGRGKYHPSVHQQTISGSTASSFGISWKFPPWIC